MDRFDVLFVIGIMLVSTGFGLLSIPLGLIAGGIGCIVFAVIAARGESRATFPAAAQRAKDKP